MFFKVNNYFLVLIYFCKKYIIVVFSKVSGKYYLLLFNRLGVIILDVKNYVYMFIYICKFRI